ncbi:MAG: hypothetical protein R3331_09220 [Sulfurospirillaceae bacterium]|nr:hypothetical protein [Sulfurospirillaceae bacterium]
MGLLTSVKSGVSKCVGAVVKASHELKVQTLGLMAGLAVMFSSSPVKADDVTDFLTAMQTYITTTVSAISVSLTTILTSSFGLIMIGIAFGWLVHAIKKK